jgi:hypothetical protein
MTDGVINFFVKFRALFFSVALVTLLISCDNDDDMVTQPVEVAYVSIYHAAPDAPDLDIVVDGRVINFNPFDYTSYSGYLNFYTGDREIKFRAGNANNALIDTTFNFEDGKAYSLFAVNSMPDVEALLVVDTAAAPAQGKAMIRFVHLSPDAPAFELTAAGTASPLFPERSFKEATSFQEVDAKTYTFEVRNKGGSDVVLSAEDVEILPGKYYTIITRGFLNPPSGNNHVLSLEVLK